MSLFDADLSRSLKEQGLDQVEENNDFVAVMRGAAERIAREKGSVSSDDLRRYAIDHKIRPHHQNAWGAIFRGKRWRLVGRKRSKFVSNHAREIKIWELVL
jgi:hypothetical protein